ncbi:3-dehydroquinate synthase [BD1-7 clade bacterium]|uniref:3-dehydroquinate synthase n=1 Tax=BD1-7 clade bacterium TaxID=2029982 RepID=A0A5S9N2K9_9GAMM|nr:3-dehydroquinate synthase [BD1-7 clade bacterium]
MFEGLSKLDHRVNYYVLLCALLSVLSGSFILLHGSGASIDGTNITGSIVGLVGLVYRIPMGDVALWRSFVAFHGDLPSLGFFSLALFVSYAGSYSAGRLYQYLFSPTMVSLPPAAMPLMAAGQAIPFVGPALLLFSGLQKLHWRHVWPWLLFVAILQSMAFVLFAEIVNAAIFIVVNMSVAGAVFWVANTAISIFHRRTHTERYIGSYQGSRFPVVFCDQGAEQAVDALSSFLNSVQTTYQVAVCVDRGFVLQQSDKIDLLMLQLNELQKRRRRMQLVEAPLLITGGEDNKNTQMTEQIFQQLMDAGVSKDGILVVVGGGSLQDLMGFVAASFRGGLQVVRMPTTVRSQIASPVVVSCGVNAFHQRNLLGALHVPSAVVIDPCFTASLPHRDRRAGIAEAVKVALAYDREFFQWIEAHAQRFQTSSDGGLHALINRAAQINICQRDASSEPDAFCSGAGLGLWAANKLEAMNRDMRYGEALALGLSIDAAYAMSAGFLQKQKLERILTLLETLGFDCWHASASQRTADGQWVLYGGVEEYTRCHADERVPVIVNLGEIVSIDVIDRGLLMQATDYLRSRYKNHNKASSAMLKTG